MFARVKSERQAIRMVQTLINVLNGGNILRIDGIMGKQTRDAISKLSSQGRNFVEQYANSQGLALYNGGKASAFQKAVERSNLELISEPGFTESSSLTVKNVGKAPRKNFRKDEHYSWVNVVVPKSIAMFDSKGLPGYFIMLQATFESGYGKSGLSTKDLNFSGLKLNSVIQFDKQLVAMGYPKLKGSVWPTREVRNGKNVMENHTFAKFGSFEHWVECHALYLLEERYDHSGKLRFPGIRNVSSVREYGIVVQNGGYATELPKAYYKAMDDAVVSLDIRKDPMVWV